MLHYWGVSMRKFFLCCFLSFGSSALAWAPLGHETVAQIAFLNLAPVTSAKVKQILGNNTFVESANWADSVKRAPGWEHTASYHYTSVDDGGSYFETVASLPADKQNRGDIVMALSKSLLVLRDAKSSTISKKYALQFLIHFVGDIHQPLHVGRFADRGGNEISVNWYGKMANLHWIWDGSIIEVALANKLKTVPAGQQSTWLATYLLAKNSKETRYQGRLDIEEWMNGSFAIRPLVYNGYNSSNDLYVRATQPYAETQMLKAGLNLAATLNTVLADSGMLSTSESQLISSLNKSLGRDFRPLIKLQQLKR